MRPLSYKDFTKEEHMNSTRYRLDYAESKNQQAFVRQIPKDVYDAVLERKNRFGKEPEDQLFAFNSIQAVCQQLATLKKKDQFLKNLVFTPHDIRRLKAREVATKYGIEAASKELGHKSTRTTSIYLENNI